MCPATLGRYVSGTGFTSNECQCWLIRKVRVDERERRPSWAELVAQTRAATLADLRAKVEALSHTNKCDTQDPVYAGRGKTMRCTCWQADVLALMDGSSDERE